jgi:hypothetical protein
MKYRIFVDSDEDYTSIIQEEDFEEEDLEGFEGLQKGSEIDQGVSRDQAGPVPWDPSQSFFAYI